MTRLPEHSCSHQRWSHPATGHFHHQFLTGLWHVAWIPSLSKAHAAFEKTWISLEWNCCTINLPALLSHVRLLSASPAHTFPSGAGRCAYSSRYVRKGKLHMSCEGVGSTIWTVMPQGSCNCCLKNVFLNIKFSPHHNDLSASEQYSVFFMPKSPCLSLCPQSRIHFKLQTESALEFLQQVSAVAYVTCLSRIVCWGGKP